MYALLLRGRDQRRHGRAQRNDGLEAHLEQPDQQTQGKRSRANVLLQPHFLRKNEAGGYGRQRPAKCLRSHLL